MDTNAQKLNEITWINTWIDRKQIGIEYIYIYTLLRVIVWNVMYPCGDAASRLGFDIDLYVKDEVMLSSKFFSKLVSKFFNITR